MLAKRPAPIDPVMRRVGSMTPRTARAVGTTIIVGAAGRAGRIHQAAAARTATTATASAGNAGLLARPGAETSSGRASVFGSCWGIGVIARSNLYCIEKEF